MLFFSLYRVKEHRRKLVQRSINFNNLTTNLLDKQEKFPFFI